MKKTTISLIVFVLFTTFRLYSQNVTWTVNLMDRMEYDCSVFKTDFPPTTTQEVLDHISLQSNALAEFISSHCPTATTSVSISARNFKNMDQACFYDFDRYYLIDFTCDDVLNQFQFIEHFHVNRWDPDEQIPVFETEMFEWDEGYAEADLPQKKSLVDILERFPEITYSCDSDNHLTMTVTTTPGPEDECSKDYYRDYVVFDKCIQQNVAKIHETVTLISKLTMKGMLTPLEYKDDKLPQPYTNIDSLKNHGARIVYSRNETDLKVTYSDETKNPGLIFRTYRISPSKCPELSASIRQILRKRNADLVPFTIKHTNETLENFHDGKIEIIPPQFDEGCLDDPDSQTWYMVRLFNMKTFHYDDFDYTNTNDIYVIDSLAPASYIVYIYPKCTSCDFLGEWVLREEVKIMTHKMELAVTPGLSLISDHYYVSLYGSVLLEDEEGGYVPFEEYDRIVDHFKDQWTLSQGLMYSPKRKQYDLYEMCNLHMGGYGTYEWMLMHYNSLNLDYSHGLQRYIIAKDEFSWAKYRLFKHKNNPGTSGGDDPGTNGNNAPSLLPYEIDLNEYEPFKENSYQFYKGTCLLSHDPNEIFGPEGYTNTDSTCVRMINTTDDVGYTIMFENDPEYATTAAARVKIICPLSPKMDPTTFRLGNFGFNNMTFEVPELSSYYNRRLVIDSLGYWLDVTAAIEASENYAYWIFQTIDPETGVAPADSLGFLPVNDTISGCGEGFVSFTCGLANSGNRGTRTGDEIVENASIVFDENTEVPTNDYVNQFDSQAPVSTLLCNTTGAAQNKQLNIAFSANDDLGGSGVKQVELYVSIDKQGYNLVSVNHPDSTCIYNLNNGSRFEFMSLAIDNVGNKEAFKTTPGLTFVLGNPPYGLELSNQNFMENDAVGTLIGTFTTFDDQDSDQFGYTLVSGEGSTDNGLFRIDGNRLLTNYDFRCHGTYDFSIRVRTTDLTDCFLEEQFSLHAEETELAAPVLVYEYLCPGDEVVFAGNTISTEGSYYDTLQNYLHCDSVVCLRVILNPEPETFNVSDEICFGTDYAEHGFDLSTDSIAVLANGWTMQNDLVLDLENYTDNAFGCKDLTNLQLTIHPAYNFVDDVLVCPTDLPYLWHNQLVTVDTTITHSFITQNLCDSTYTLHLTINPDNGTQSDTLGQGWYWYSTYIDQSNGKGLANLEAALGTNGNIIKSKTQFVQYSPSTGIWFGSLTGISNQSSYMIRMNDNQIAEVFGCFADVQACPDTIVQGWNWIGFPSRLSMDLNTVTTGMNVSPSNGDLLKSKSTFATYSSADGEWQGPLTMLEPGEGYMYQSHNATPVVLTYPAVTRATGTPYLLPEAHWQADEHKYADNMTFVGLIELDGKPMESDTLEVGAFCGNEERGSARAIYLEGADMYRVFLTVQGEEDDLIDFRLYDHSRDKERRIRGRNNVIFHADEHHGTLDRPYPFSFHTDYDRLIEAEICEGDFYKANGFSVCQQGTYFQESSNDSIIRLDLTVNPVYHLEKEVVAVEFPTEFDGITFKEPGTFTLPFETAELCDSVVVYTVKPYEGERDLLISPVPVERGQTATLFFPFTAEEEKDLIVEVYSLAGNLIQTIKPKRYPIELKPFVAAGTYMVRITMGTGEAISKKIVVR